MLIIFVTSRKWAELHEASAFLVLAFTYKTERLDKNETYCL